MQEKKVELKDRKPLTERLRVFAPVFLFLPLLLFIGGDEAILLVNQVLIIADFQLSSFALVGAIVGVGQITLACSTLVFGYLADKFSRKKILITGGLIWAAGEFLCAISRSPIQLFLFRIIAAMGAGSSAPVTISLLSDIFPSKERGNSFAWWGLATTIGGIAGGSVALSFNRIPAEVCDFANEYLSLSDRIQCIIDNAGVTFPSEYLTYWRYPFYLMAAIGLVCSLLILLVKEPKRGIAEESLHDVLLNENVDYSHSYRIKIKDLKYLYTRKSNFWLIINFVDTIFSGLVLGFLFVWLQMEVGINVNNLGPQIPILLPFTVVIVLFLLWGQFWFARKGDQKVRSGDYAGRVKVAIFCGVTHIPFLMIGFLFYPDLSNFTFFKGGLDLSGNIWGFVLLLLLMGLIVGLGLGIEFGVAPAWYASMIDVNLPEHRGTMIAAAAFMDAIGRGFGAYVGALIIDYFNGLGSVKPIGDTIVFCTFTFGVLSAVLWLPILKYAKHDFKEVSDILKERAKILEQQKDQANQNNVNKENPVETKKEER